MSAAGQAFPWRRFMWVGLGVLRLSPREFWAATPCELAAAFWCESGQPLARADLDTLVQRFPDSP